ncbi:MAG TPA: serine/threonine-protein kinase [Solirubrobacteraceae bacterium]|nr:serine/threonine-protein kinase [Solirubrobacteraceae bacterium]
MAAIELAPGATLGEGGRYRLERVLGTGGMASVWLAMDARLDREVAVKVLSDVLALDEDYVRRFEREAHVVANLSHPHLVRVYDFSVHARRPYLVMEYVAGGSLADRLRDSDRDHGTLDADVLARELLDALGYIHHAGVIHRDIKPANVLIGCDGRARLTDFGIAQPSDATHLTKTGVVVGSARYIAPEVMRGRPASERSDLYSLGVLIEQCLAPAPTPELRALVRQLTAERPDRRPASARQAINALEPGATQPTRHRDHPTARRMDHPTARHMDHPTARRMDHPTAPTTPRFTRYGRGSTPIDVRRSTVALAVLLALLVIALIGLATSGGGSGTTGQGPTRANANAPLSSQLTQLDRAIDNSRR